MHGLAALQAMDGVLDADPLEDRAGVVDQLLLVGPEAEAHPQGAPVDGEAALAQVVADQPREACEIRREVVSIVDGGRYRRLSETLGTGHTAAPWFGDFLAHRLAPQ